MSLLEEAWVGAGFDESKHPRFQGGVPEGGRFRSKFQTETIVPTTESLRVLRDQLVEAHDAGLWPKGKTDIPLSRGGPPIGDRGTGRDLSSAMAHAFAALEGGAIDEMFTQPDVNEDDIEESYGETQAHIIVVRDENAQVVGVMDFADMPGSSLPLYGGAAGATKGAGMPLFAAFLDEAAARGKGAAWSAGNRRAGDLYARLGVPTRGGPGRFSLTPEEVRLMADDMFALARDKRAATAALVAAGWVESDHPRDPKDTATGGQFTGKQDEGLPTLEWQDPPEPKGQAGERKAGGYSSDRAYGTNTTLGRVGEREFTELTGGKIMHPEGKGEQSPIDVVVGGYGYEVKAVSTESTSFKATPKKYEIAQKAAEAKRLGVKPALSIVVVDRDTNKAHVYWRPGLKGGRLSKNTGWRYAGSTSLDAETASGWDESEHPRYARGQSDGGQFRPKDTAGDALSTDWMEKARVRRAFQNEKQAEAMAEYYAHAGERTKYKVGVSTNLKDEWVGWAESTGERFVMEDGSTVAIVDPTRQAVLDNWGNWTDAEVAFLQGELRKQLSDGEWVQDPNGEFGERVWSSGGLLSGQYAKEIGRSLSQARNEGRRVYDQLDKQAIIKSMGEDYAREQYPELFEQKAKKVTIDPRSQGIPDVYLSENGKFKPGFDAKAKSDLVNSALDVYPKQQVVSTSSDTVTPQTQSEVTRWWKERNADEQARNNWPDSEIWKIAKNDPMMPGDLQLKVRQEQNVRVTRNVESTLLHRFDPAEARRILTERGWIEHLYKRENALGLAYREPPRTDQMAHDRLKEIYGDNMGVTGFHYGRTQELVGEAGDIPDEIHRGLAASGQKLYFGTGESTDLDEMWHIRDEKARNRDRRTMKQVAGFNSPSSGTTIISTDPRYGSQALAAHEVGHAIGDVYTIDNSDRLYRYHQQFYSKLRRYYVQDGPNGIAGRQELWAESVADHVRRKRDVRLGRKQYYEHSGPFKSADTWNTPEGREYRQWVDDTMARLAEVDVERISPGTGAVAPEGFRWVLDPVLGINLLEPR